MNTIEEQIKALEEEIRKLPYHKGTERHIGVLRARISILKDKQLENASRKSGGGGGYAVKKQGDATVVLVGPPSAGKSTILNALTNAESKVAPYAFTTVSVIPGMMKYKDAYIQILDVPGLIEGAEEGKGRGREVIAVIRNTDLLIIMSDTTRLDAIPRIQEALERNGIRVNKRPQKIRVKKHLNGGLTINTNIRQDLDKDTIKDVLTQMGIKSADVYLEENITLEGLIDAISKNRVYIPALYVVNKVDNGLPKNIPEEIKGKLVQMSADKGIGMNAFQEKIWKALGLCTIYLLKPLQEVNKDNSMVARVGMTLQEVMEDIGTEFSDGKTKAKIWGNGAKFDGQEVSLATQIQEDMIVRFI